MSSSKFKDEHTVADRTAESARIRDKYSDRIPIIVERGDSKSKVPDIDKKKYLVPGDLTAGQFMYVIRKRLKLSANEAIYLFTEKGTIPSTGTLISDLYQSNKDEDGFLYITYSGENVFG